MKKCILFCLTVAMLSSPLSFCFADDSDQDHICFKRIDSNHDDTVTLQEFEKIFGKDAEKFQAMDQNNDGKLSHDEYEEYRYNQED